MCYRGIRSIAKEKLNKEKQLTIDSTMNIATNQCIFVVTNEHHTFNPSTSACSYTILGTFDSVILEETHIACLL